MDKQQLLNYFQTHYLSRQEVLFRLPLNYSIDTFWPELLNWRKGHATMLPLYTPSGRPYWYVTTDKMIQASERLCEEALRADGSFDPYRVQMTPAMSQEAYFTSFVEGAEYTLEEAVAFLRRGTDPENMHEQNILNNHQAWSYMLGSLNIPFGEQFVKDLAFYLTEGQNDGSIDYRQEDSAEIPAMAGEDYVIPPAFSLPDRMAQFYQFLADSNIHPLIKAAAAQAWIFAVRPFPEANERLARMISSAVLLRCGYDYFLDISISANIAHESFRYFKAIKETIRSENDGDLTYFVEYYIQLLARSLAAHRESRQQEALEAERQMAMRLLTPSPPVQDFSENSSEEHRSDDLTEPHTKSAQHYADSGGRERVDSDIEALIRGAVPITQAEPMKQAESVIQKSEPMKQAKPRKESGSSPAEMPDSTSSVDQQVVSVPAHNSQSPSIKAPRRDRKALVQTPQDMSRYKALLADIAPFAPIKDFSKKMCAILELGLYRFTALEWSEVNLLDNDKAIQECDTLYCMQILDRYLRCGHYFYLLRFESPAELEELVRYQRIHAPFIAPSGDPNFWMQLASLEASKSDTLRLAASTIRSMLNESVFEFTKSDWIGRTGMSTSQYKFFRNEMKKRKMAVFVGDPDNAYPNNEGVFRFSIAEDLAGIPDMQPIPLSIPDEAAPAIESADSDIAPGTETTILDDGDMDAEIWDDNRAEPELYRDLPIQWFPTYESIPSLQTLTTISFGDDSPRIQRIHDFLIHRGSDEAYFTAAD